MSSCLYFWCEHFSLLALMLKWKTLLCDFNSRLTRELFTIFVIKAHFLFAHNTVQKQGLDDQSYQFLVVDQSTSFSLVDQSDTVCATVKVTNSIHCTITLDKKTLCDRRNYNILTQQVCPLSTNSQRNQGKIRCKHSLSFQLNLALSQLPTIKQNVQTKRLVELSVVELCWDKNIYHRRFTCDLLISTDLFIWNDQ